jgi:hypothetical protein
VSSPRLKEGTQAPHAPGEPQQTGHLNACYVASGQASGSLRVTRTLNATVPYRTPRRTPRPHARHPHHSRCRLATRQQRRLDHLRRRRQPPQTRLSRGIQTVAISDVARACAPLPRRGRLDERPATRHRPMEGTGSMKWNLRLAAANRGIWKASELQRMLAERGMVISAGKMSGLWSGHPNTVRRHCCIKAKGVLAAPQRGDAGPSCTWRTATNRAFECLLRGFWTGEWITSGDPNAQCNSADAPAWPASRTGPRWPPSAPRAARPSR